MAKSQKLKLNKSKLNIFHNAFKSYSDSYNRFKELDEKTQNIITDKLTKIESRSSVEIENKN